VEQHPVMERDLSCRRNEGNLVVLKKRMKRKVFSMKKRGIRVAAVIKNN
jgi:hypothetical protein